MTGRCMGPLGVADDQDLGCYRSASIRIPIELHREVCSECAQLDLAGLELCLLDHTQHRMPTDQCLSDCRCVPDVPHRVGELGSYRMRVPSPILHWNPYRELRI